MYSIGANALILGGVFSTLAAIAHLACIAGGGPAFRVMGAGERMARAIEAGNIQPILVTLGLATVLSIWAAYAFSGAGVIGKLPFAKLMLPAIAGVFLARGVGFPLLKPLFPGNSNTFWLVSSGICFAIGALYAAGTAAVWERL